MYTHCPECSTYFRITAEQLRAAQGKVRCSNCDTVFNALENLEETLPAGQVTANEDTPPPKEKKQKPKKAAKAKKPKKPGGFGRLIKALFGLLFAVILLVAIVGQLAYFKRDTVAQKFPVLRPQLEMACGYLKAYVSCEISMPRDLDKLELAHKDVRLHPKLNHALLINANLVNQADFAQPYPLVVLTFTDNQDRIVAKRAFKPSEYLSDPEMAGAGLGPHESALLVLEVLDPGPTAINFTFDFE
jgi:predicted Zn finger-like uncharacterized protein